MAGMRFRPLAAVLILLLPLLAGGDMGQSMSALRRTILASNPIAYWPLEDESGATSGAPAVGGTPASVTGTVVWAGETDLPGATQAPTLTDGALSLTVSGGSATAWTVELLQKGTFYVETPFVNIYAGGVVFGVFAPVNTGDYVFLSADVVGGEGNYGVLDSGAAAGAGWENVWHHIAVTVEQDGADIDVALYINGALYDSTTMASVTPGAVTSIRLNKDVWPEVTSISHVAVFNGTTISGAANAMDAYVGETPAARFARLCTESGIAYDVRT